MRILTQTFQKIDLMFFVIIAALFQLWDAVITYIYVTNGSVSEGNPLMVPLLKNGIFLPERFFSAGISVLLIYLLSKYSSKIAQSACIGIIMLYSITLAWNYSILSRA